MAADVIAGRFALCDPIGSGGSGTVWRAYDHKLEGYCAAKLLRQRDAGDLLRFVREQSVRLDHPHIVSPYSWVAEDGTVLIASALVTGGSLHTLIGDNGSLAESTVATVLRQVLAGLQAVHDAQLIHRDVKPANLMLQATGTGPLHVVLTDFGLTISRLDARLTQVGMVIGTPGYVPPEVLLGGVPPDPRHDLYAAGRLALTMIAGEEPGGHLIEVMGSVRDPSLRATIEALLRHDPDERPADAKTAMAMLAGVPGEQGPRTRDGDRIDVLDQLPELPAGWGPDGPDDPTAGRSLGAPRATIVDVVPTAPAMAGLGPQMPQLDTELEPPLPPQLQSPLPQSLQSRQSPQPPQSLQPQTSQLQSPPPIRAQPPTAPAGTKRRRAFIAAAITAVLVVALVLVVRVVLDGSSTTVTDPPTTATTSSPVNSSSSSPATEGTSVEQTTTGAPPPTRVSPTATASVPVADLRAGDGCTWQLEGDRQIGVDGAVLVCTLVDGSYQWRLPG